MKIFVDKIDNYNDNDYLTFLELLNNEKKCQVNHINDIKKKKQSILGEVLLIRALKENGIDYDTCEIIKNKNGKPYIKNSNLKYNISHSDEVVCLVFSKRDIGVDVEKIKKVNVNVINFFASDNEKKWILEEEAKIIKRLFILYTLKEAYVKMLGQTINSLLDIEFIINNQIYCSDKSIQYIVKEDIPNYIISICERNI